jgi:hypothetical protein
MDPQAARLAVRAEGDTIPKGLGFCTFVLPAPVLPGLAFEQGDSEPATALETPDFRTPVFLRFNCGSRAPQ